MSVCKLFLDETPHSGVWNMAMDEALLERALHQDWLTVRVYRWELPTISLGYFQKNEVDSSLAHLPRVRRLTGGGAILHHREITYSCSLPASHPLADESERMYETVHAAIINCLTAHDVGLSMRGTTVHAEGGFHAEPFLCFGRQDARDLVLSGNKVVGSAQRRRRGALLQHGSVVLEKSPFAPDFDGIVDMQPGANLPPTAVLMSEIGDALAGAFEGDFRVLKMDETLRADVEQWATEKYLHLDWKRK